MTDKQRLDFLELNRWRGPCILNDNNDHWAIVMCFYQKTNNVKITKVTDREHAAETEMEFYVPEQEWKNSLREAIDSYIQKCHDFDCNDAR